jgi:hypothetical protein
MNAASQDSPLAYHFGNTQSRFVSLGQGGILSGPLIGLVLHILKGRILMLILATLRLLNAFSPAHVSTQYALQAH